MANFDTLKLPLKRSQANEVIGDEIIVKYGRTITAVLHITTDTRLMSFSLSSESCTDKSINLSLVVSSRGSTFTSASDIRMRSLLENGMFRMFRSWPRRSTITVPLVAQSHTREINSVR